MWIWLYCIIMLPVAAVIIYGFHLRGRYKNRKGAGAFFFEDGSLVLNTGIPYPIPFGEIDYVELQYNPKALEQRWSFELWVKVVRRDGKTKRVFYKGYRTAKLATPADMRAALEAHGIRCVDSI